MLTHGIDDVLWTQGKKFDTGVSCPVSFRRTLQQQVTVALFVVCDARGFLANYRSDKNRIWRSEMHHSHFPSSLLSFLLSGDVWL